MIELRARSVKISLLVLVGAALLLAAPFAAQANPCEVTDVGGTVVLPPAGCEYLSPDEVHMILDGLPAGTTIELAAIHKDFICERGGGFPVACSVPIPPGACETQGGSLGGNLDCFDSVAELQVTGTGALNGFNRNLFVPLNVEVHTGPRTPGNRRRLFRLGISPLRY